MCIGQDLLLLDSRDTEMPRFVAMLVLCSCKYTAEPQIREGFRASTGLNLFEGLACGPVQQQPPENLEQKVPRGLRGCRGERGKLTLRVVSGVNTATPGCTRVFSGPGYHSLRLVLPEGRRVGLSIQTVVEC